MWPSASASSRRPASIPRAVVDDLELERVADAAQGDRDPLGARVAGGVGEQLAGDREQQLVVEVRAPRARARSRSRSRPGGPAWRATAPSACSKPALLEGHRVQGHHRLAQARDRRRDDLVRALHLGPPRAPPRSAPGWRRAGSAASRRGSAGRSAAGPGPRRRSPGRPAGGRCRARRAGRRARRAARRSRRRARPATNRAARAASPRRRRRRGRRPRASRRASAGGSSPSWSRGGSACRSSGAERPLATRPSTSCSRSVSFGGPPLRSRSWICCARPACASAASAVPPRAIVTIASQTSWREDSFER